MKEATPGGCFLDLRLLRTPLLQDRSLETSSAALRLLAVIHLDEESVEVLVVGARVDVGVFGLSGRQQGRGVVVVILRTRAGRPRVGDNLGRPCHQAALSLPHWRLGRRPNKLPAAV